MHDKLLEPRYSGEASVDIWERIAGIKDPEGALIYIAACALQDHEQRFLQMIQKNAAKAPQPPEPTTVAKDGVPMPDEDASGWTSIDKYNPYRRRIT